MSTKEKDVELSQAEIKARQADLVDRISRLVGDKSLGYTLASFAEEIGLSVSAVSASQNHRRWWGRSPKEVLEKVAKALHVPVAQVFFSAGVLTAEDFLESEGLSERLEVVFSLMSRDPAMRGICPTRATWIAWPDDAKLALGMLYEQRPGGIRVLEAASPQRDYNQGKGLEGNKTMLTINEETQAGRAKRLAQTIGFYTMGVMPAPEVATKALEICNELGASLDFPMTATNSLLTLAQQGVQPDPTDTERTSLATRARAEILKVQQLLAGG